MATAWAAGFGKIDLEVTEPIYPVAFHFTILTLRIDKSCTREKKMCFKSKALLFLASASTLFLANPALAQNCDPLQVYANLDIITNEDTGDFAFPVLVNDTTKYFMAGTTYTFSSINESVVEELGITTTATSATMVVSTGNVFVPSLARPEQFRIGNLQADHIPLQVSLGTGPDGVIGANILREYDVEVDFVNRKFLFVSQNHCSAYLPHWGDVPVGAVAMDVTRVQGTPTIRVTANGVNLDADISFASGNTVMNQTIARRRLDIDLDGEGVEEVGEIAGGGRRGTMYLTSIDTLEIGPFTLTDVEMSLMPDLLSMSRNVAPSPNSLINTNRDVVEGLQDIVLGMSVLRNFRAFMSYSENRLYLTPARAAAAPDTVSTQ